MGLYRDLGAALDAGKATSRIIAERYEVRDRIGRGAFGEVFEVYDHRLARLVALKTLPIDAMASLESTEDLRRFHLEARAVARLSHPGIVTVHDFGETKDFAWIAMELVIGETLKAVLDRGERPSLAETVRVTCALLDALHYAHGRGIVHRDVKPANVLLAVTAEDGLGEVRLADFGIARIGESQQTVAGQVIGTPVAMSPEQVRGEEVDLRADLWSVGVILYQLLTGRRPFPGSMPAILHNILTQNPVAPSLVAAGLPPALDAVIATALAKNPRDRYADAAVMAAALRAAVLRPAAPAVAAASWPKPDLAEEQEARTVRLVRRAPVAPAGGEAPVPGAPVLESAVRRTPSAGWALAFGFAAGALCGAFITHQLLTQGGVAAATARPTGAVASAGAPDPRPIAAPDADLLRIAELLPVAPFAPPAPEVAPPPPEVPEPRIAGSADRGDAEAAPHPVQAEPPGPAPAAVPGPEPVSGAAEPPAVQASLPALRPTTGGGSLRCEPDRLITRTGSHPGFGRVVFDWTAPVRHELLRAEGGALLRFPGAGCLPSVDRLALPRNVLGIRPDQAGGGLRIETAPGARLRLARFEGNRVVLDVLDGGE